MIIMLDFETLANHPDTAVISLGAVAFNRQGIIHKAEWFFDLDEQLRLGRAVTGDTLKWWFRQKDQARAVFNSNEPKVRLDMFFAGFEAFIDDALKKVGEGRDELKPCGNGANFDVSILDNLYRRHHLLGESAIPYRFWNIICFRTFAMLTKCKDKTPRKNVEGVKHSALDDALYQTKCMMNFWHGGKE